VPRFAITPLNAGETLLYCILFVSLFEIQLQYLVITHAHSVEALSDIFVYSTVIFVYSTVSDGITA